MLKQAIYYANIATGKYSKAEWGHMIDGYVGDMTHIIESYKNIEWDRHGRKKLLSGENGVYFGGQFGFYRYLYLGIIFSATDSYKDTHSREYYPKYSTSFSQARLNEKKALAKWLNDVFYPYINKLDVKDNKYDMVKHELEKIKETMVIK